MVGGDLRADRDQLVLGDAEFGQLHLRLDLSHREPAALGLRDVLDLGFADAELHRGVAVLLFRAMRDDLAALDLENRDRHMIARVGEDAGHPSFCAIMPERMAFILQSAFAMRKRRSPKSLRA